MALHIVSWKQLAVNSLLISVTVAALVDISYLHYERMLLPELHVSAKDNSCIKIINFANGDAYNCNDLDITLRRYKKVIQ